MKEQWEWYYSEAKTGKMNPIKDLFLSIIDVFVHVFFH